MSYRVLCLDGGGIRGVFSAHFLHQLEVKLGKPLRNCFDLVVGTSTGGIIALAVAYEKPMDLITKLYSQHAKEVFPLRRFTKIRNIFTAKYSNEPLVEHLKSIFGFSTLFKNPSCRICVQSYDIQGGRSKIFRAGSSTSAKDSELYIWQVAAATSAAPTYFPAFHVKGNGLFVDGGIWANNPALVGVIEAMRLGASLSDIRLLSVGTGERIFRQDKPRSGYLSWGLDLMEMTFHSQSSGVDQLASLLFQSTGTGESSSRINYYKRINRALLEKESGLDSIGSIETLKILAEQEAEHTCHELSVKFDI